METRYLRTLYDLSQTLNITRTGARLDYAPSSVAAHIHALELEAGVPLIERNGRAITLTDAGRALAQHARKVLDAERDMFASARSAGGERSIAIGSVTSVAGFFLPGVVAAMRSSEQALAIAVRQMDCHAIPPALASGEIDAGFALEASPSLEKLRVAGVTAIPLTETRIVAVTSRTHPLASIASPGACALEGTTIILTEPGCTYREAFTAYLDDNGVQTAAAIEMENFEAIKRCVAGGIGIAYLPQFIVRDELESGEFAEIAIGPEETYTVALGWRTGIDPAILANVREAAERGIRRERITA